MGHLVQRAASPDVRFRRIAVPLSPWITFVLFPILSRFQKGESIMAIKMRCDSCLKEHDIFKKCASFPFVDIDPYCHICYERHRIGGFCSGLLKTIERSSREREQQVLRDLARFDQIHPMPEQSGKFTITAPSMITGRPITSI